MATTVNADASTGGVVLTGDGSGVLELQAAGVTKATINSSGMTLADPLPIASGGTGSTTGVSLSAGVTGILPIANGGTNSTATPTAGSVGYGTGTAHAYSAAGTAGQFLVSNGASAPTWSTSTSFVVQGTASGAIAANKPVVVNADGTFTQVGLQASTTTLTAVAATDLVTSTANSFPMQVFDSTNNKFVRFYANGFALYYVVGTSDGTTVTWGTQQSVPTPGSASFDYSGSATFHVASGCVVLTFADNVATAISAIAGTISGSTITWGSSVSIYAGTGAISQPVGIYDSTNQKVVFIYNAASGGSANVISCTAGRVITVGTQAVFDGNSSRFLNGCYDSTNGKIVVYYRPNIAGTKPYYVVGTVSGTTISFGTPTIVYNATADIPNVTTKGIAYDVSKNRVVVLYQDGTNWVLQAGQVSGSTITWGTAVSTAIPSINQDQVNIVYDSTNGQTALFYAVSSNSYKVLGFSLSGSVITIGNITNIFSSATTSGLTCVFDTQYAKFLPIYYDATLAKVYDKYVFYGSYNLTSKNFIGFSTSAVSGGATVTIGTIGGLDLGQTGLTAGQTYYVQNTGTLSTTADSPSVYAGVAYGTTKLIIKG